MALDLSSVNAKLNRADSHLNAYRDEVTRWAASNPYHLSTGANADSTRHHVAIHITENPDFESWSLIIGDCVHNLRSALEHLVYAIAVNDAGQNPPPD